MIAEPLKHLAVAIADLSPDPANARKHGTKNLDAIKSSLAKFGQRKPIVVQRDGMVVRAGNGTLAAAKSLGWSEIAAVVLDDDNATASQFAIADNRSAELAEWDDDVLATLLDGMDDAHRDAIGFEAEDVDALLNSLEPHSDRQDPSGDGGPMLGDVSYSVQVMCSDEFMQAELLHRLSEEGFTCKALMS